MIDIHCHIFNFQSIPDAYFCKNFLRRSYVEKVAELGHILSPSILPGRLGSCSFLINIGLKSSEEIFQRMRIYYPANTIFVPLMIDFDYACAGTENMTYNAQMAKLIELKVEFSEIIYPFLAVDPRRPGIVELVKSHVGKGKPFHGIKLYPPFGFLPSHPVLMNIFEYCQNNSIPVTTHCAGYCLTSAEKNISVEGLQYNYGQLERINTVRTFKSRREKWEYFADPVKWLPVLHCYPDLYLNLAHFGGHKEFLKYMKGKMGTWTDKIINLIIKYEHVYTDISYILFSREILVYLKKMIRSSIGHKILFGTDAYLVLLEGYFNTIMNKCFVEFSVEEFHTISVKNNRAFLNFGDEG